MCRSTSIAEISDEAHTGGKTRALHFERNDKDDDEKKMRTGRPNQQEGRGGETNDGEVRPTRRKRMGDQRECPTRKLQLLQERSTRSWHRYISQRARQRYLSKSFSKSKPAFDPTRKRTPHPYLASGQDDEQTRVEHKTSDTRRKSRNEPKNPHRTRSQGFKHCEEQTGTTEAEGVVGAGPSAQVKRAANRNTRAPAPDQPSTVLPDTQCTAAHTPYAQTNFNDQPYDTTPDENVTDYSNVSEDIIPPPLDASSSEKDVEKEKIQNTPIK